MGGRIAMSNDEDKLADLLLKWEEAWEQGDDLPADQLCADHPNLVEPLRQRIDRLKQMQWMSRDDGEEPESERSQRDPLLGQILAERYTIESLVGIGGFGRVYRAFDDELQRHVALKIARADRLRPTDDLLHEARRAAKLRHSGIVAVHDVGRHDGSVFIVSDLIEGRSLAEVISEEKPPSRQAAEWIAECADALQTAHDQGFVHRDIKPSNILIDHQGRALVTDFGIAATTEQIHQGETPSLGTLAYMAPEQFSGETTLVGPKTDIFALGVVLYELLTGTHPFAARTEAGWRQNILLRIPPLPTSICPDIPDTLASIAVRCLAKHPAERFESAAELAETLRIRPAAARQQFSSTWLIALPCLLLLVGLPYFALIFLNHGGASDPLLKQNSVDRNLSDMPRTVKRSTSVGLHFDGEHRIVTPVEKSLPLTIEAWVRPRQQQTIAYFVGSDILGEWGMSIGTFNSIFTAQRIRGSIVSKAVVPVGQWTHVATVFGENQTRLYVNGKHVESGPPSKLGRNAPFVIGGIGYDNRLYQFVGDIRAVRISQSERFTKEFVPDDAFEPDPPQSATKSILIYDRRSIEGKPSDDEFVRDLSGHGNHGRWELSRPSDPPPSLPRKAFVFDGSTYIQTPVERFAPVTLEAWIMPTERPKRTGFVIGSDIPSKYGIGITLSPANLSAEYLHGLHVSKTSVPMDVWSHVAAVFSASETRLYLNGHHVSTGPATEIAGGTRFVIGRAGEDNPSDYFLGRIRSLRISRGERYAGDFQPHENFSQGTSNQDDSTILIYEGTTVKGDTVPDLSGQGNTGTIISRSPSPIRTGPSGPDE